MIYLKEPFKSLWQEQDVFAAVDRLQGTIYRQIARRRTLRFEVEGVGYFVKVHHGVGWREILKNLLMWRLPVLGAKQEFEAIRHLTAINLATMTLAGYGIQGWNPANRDSFVITEDLANTISLEDYCKGWQQNKPSFRDKLVLIKRVAEIARSMHASGMNHRDFYLCHFLLSIDDADLSHTPIYLIDLHRAQIRQKVPGRWLIKDLAGLYFSAMDFGLNQRDWLRFIKHYSAMPVAVALTEQAVLWQTVEKQAIKLYRKQARKGLEG